ncbi:MAG: hypothetical protein J0L92_37640 [Deltaproteobacteria bacterium]|nr:hypothetical protein [Deltaproteobacteria bacterium]
MSLRALPFALLALVTSFALAGCPSGDRPMLGSIERTTGTVSETLRIAIPVTNPSGTAVRYRFEPTAPIPALDSVASISGSPSGGELRWTPLASHVGMHEIEIVIESSSGEEYDRTTALVEILPSGDAAPVFLEPGAGGTFDLARDPCVRFRVEIRDDDSPGVEINGRGELPTGATLSPDGGKSADFEWCPTADQIAASERWTIGLQADDGDHDPVPHDFVVVLRSGGGTGCDGAAPVVTVTSPEGAARVTSGIGYDVVVTATDDVGLREPPILYWTTETLADPSRPDVTEFEQALFENEGGDGFRARVPSLGLAVGEEREVFFIVSATDNDDATGTFCDHRTETLLSSFTAIGGEGGSLAACARCTASVECSSGICAPSAGGARCLAGCSAGTCTGGLACTSVTTSEGGSTDACAGSDGSVASACGSTCVNDGEEPNDTIATASSITSAASGQICSGDRDVFEIASASAMSQVTVTLDGFRSSEGDLDLRLLDATGRILGSSAGVMDTETVTYCAGSSGALYAEVFGFMTAQNAYDLSVTVNPGGCCVNDTSEPDDSVGTARLVSGGDFEGTLCLEDDDYRSFDVTSSSRVVITVVADGLAIVDFELYDALGARVATSSDVGGTLTIDRTLSPGRYAIRVYGYMSEGDAYLGQIEIMSAGPSCTATRDCATGQVCSASACIPDDCTPGGAACPSMHRCPDPGPTTASSDCVATCLVNADCRAGESCKWFDGGRGCAQHGSGTLGAACTSFRDCGVQRTCVDWPGGMCTRAGCTRNSDCESGSYCANVAGIRACALDCSTDMGRCRSGYTCRSISDLSGTSRFVCAP